MDDRGTEAGASFENSGCLVKHSPEIVDVLQRHERDPEIGARAPYRDARRVGQHDWRTFFVLRKAHESHRGVETDDPVAPTFQDPGYTTFTAAQVHGEPSGWWK